MAIGALVGAPTAVVAALFQAIVHDVEHWLWNDLPERLGHHTTAPWYLVLALPVAGAFIVLGARRLLPGNGGHSPLEGIGGGSTPPLHAPGIAVAALGSLAFGAVLGPEAPLIALGSATALTIALLIRLRPNEEPIVATAGSTAAISALFGGPLVAAMMMLEGGVGLGLAVIPLLLPGFVAAAVGYVIFIGFGNWGGLGTASLSVPGLPEYQGTHLLDLLVAIAVGIAAAVVLTGVRRLGAIVHALERQRLSVVLPLGGLAVGALAELANVLGAHANDVFFSGQASVPVVIAESSGWIVLLLLAAKGLGYAISLGCGFRGGPVFPAIFLGIALGTFAELAFGVSPTLAVAVGAAGGMAAMTRLLVTPVLFATLLVGRPGLDVAPAAVLAACTAWFAMQLLDPPSSER
jgi:chloride channel protein, CIC family